MAEQTEVKAAVNNPNSFRWIYFRNESKINLIRVFFDAKLQEIKALTSVDRDQLASGIARLKGLTKEETGWELVNY